MNLRRCFSIILVAAAGSLGGCGGRDTEEAETPREIQVTTAPQIKNRLKNLGAQFIAFDRKSLDEPNVLLPVSRQLPLFGFDGLIEPEKSIDPIYVESFLTGLGLEAQDSEGADLKVSIALIAREYDSQQNKFSGQTRLFTSTDPDLVGAQQFESFNPQNSGLLIVGLGLHLRDARFTKFVVQRKTLEGIQAASLDTLEAAHLVSLPPGWAMTGLLVRVAKTAANKIPFVQDAVVYSAELVQE